MYFLSLKKKKSLASNPLLSCAQLCLALCSPMDYITCQAPLSKEFSRQEHWIGLPFPTPRDLLSLLRWQADFFTTSTTLTLVCLKPRILRG